LIVVTLAQVLPGIHAFNTYVRIEKLDRRNVPLSDGSELIIAEGEAADDTGIIKFRVVGGIFIFIYIIYFNKIK